MALALCGRSAATQKTAAALRTSASGLRLGPLQRSGRCWQPRCQHVAWPPAAIPQQHGWSVPQVRRAASAFHAEPSAAAYPRRARQAWPQESVAEPVSQESLAGIPFAGRSTLPWLMQRVATNGPNDPATWRKLVARADVIAHSLTSKQVALMVTALARAKHRNEAFLRRFCVKFLPSHVESAELLDFCGILSGLSQLGVYAEETFVLFARRAALSAPQLDSRQLSLVANAFARVSHTDEELVSRLLQQVPRRLRSCTGRDVAVLLNALTQLGGRGSIGSDPMNPDLEQPLQAIALRLPELLPSADLHSLTLILNSFAQLQFLQKDALDLIVDDLLSDRQRLQRMTPRQLAMLLNAAAKLQLYEPRLLDVLVQQVRLQARQLDGQALCVVANASAKLRLGVETFGLLYAQVPRNLTRLSGRQLAMLCHAWAKAHVHNDDLFQLLALPLARHAASLAAHEVAITVYGYAHFRKSPPELFQALLQRFGELLQCPEGQGDHRVSDIDLLMLGNALGRVGFYDSSVAAALQEYSQRVPDLLHLTPQAVATFALTDAAAAATSGAAAAPPQSS